MTYMAQEYEEELARRWTREEIRKIEKRQREMRRRIWWEKYEYLVAGAVASIVSAAILLWLIEANL